MATPDEVDAAGSRGIEVDTLIPGLGTALVTRYADTSYDMGRVEIEEGRWYHVSSGRTDYEYGLLRVVEDGVLAFTREEVGASSGELLPNLNSALRYLFSQRIVPDQV